MTTKTRITIDPRPRLSWEVPIGAPNTKYEFIVEVAEDSEFTKNVRSYSSQQDKENFSFASPREANSGEVVSLRLPDALIPQPPTED